MASATSTPLAPGTRSGRSARSSGRVPTPSSSTSSSTSPTRLSRLQEKDALRSLNDRLANYIQRVQELESERAALLVRLEQNEESKSREMSHVRRMYEEELADVRSSLDGVATERARLQIECGGLTEENKKLHSRQQKSEADLTSAVSQWRRAEAALTSRDAEVSKLRSDKQRLEEQTSDLQDQLRNVEGELANTKNLLSDEMVQRIDAQNQLQTAKEQLAFEKNLSEQETQEIRSRSESRLLEVETARRTEFESKLADAMTQLRHDHEAQLLQYREELDKTFTSKLQNAQQTVKDKTNSISATKDELENAKLRLETLSSQLQSYHNEKMSLESRVQELERTLDRERQVWQERLSAKEQEMLGLRSQMFSQLEDYEKLLDTKLALDMEINAYRKMLEVEEQRLQLSPSPSQRTAVSRTQEERQRLRGRKRKHEGPTGSSPASKMSSCSSESGSVSVSEVDAKGRFIRLKNNSSIEQCLGGWVVRRLYPDSGEISFDIPSPCVLTGGQTLTIWAAGSEEEAESRDLVLESHATWGPATDVRIILLNPNYEEVSERRTRIQTDPDLDFEEFMVHSEMQQFRRQDHCKDASCAVM
ncbi:lamin L3 isoform X2 [Periophthalmus magnuspinnatus]|uniref:lamin L3 isoform X2 n=1 Tax=Periophthalmus magnuspinnatus TaxID=409849 RepID=UPI00145AE3B3|nr:lamin L3 isoform X2 [Periophthalmus magnuspinnatus]